MTRHKIYYAENRERIISRVKRWALVPKNAEHRQKYLAAWRSENKESVSLKNRRYRENNKERIAATYRVWAEANKEKKKEYAKNNAYRWVAYAAYRRTLQKIIPREERNAVNFLYAFAKALSAGGEKHVCDHILPVNPRHKRYVGLTNTNNLRIISSAENTRKRDNCPLGLTRLTA